MKKNEELVKMLMEVFELLWQNSQGRANRYRRKITERQQFVIDLRKKGKSLDEIGIAYQKQFGTKQKLCREKIRDILSMFGMT